MKADSNGKIERVVWMILDMIGEDPDPEGLLDSPARVGRMYQVFLVDILDLFRTL